MLSHEASDLPHSGNLLMGQHFLLSKDALDDRNGWHGLRDCSSQTLAAFGGRPRLRER